MDNAGDKKPGKPGRPRKSVAHKRKVKARSQKAMRDRRKEEARIAEQISSAVGVPVEVVVSRKTGAAFGVTEDLVRSLYERTERELMENDVDWSPEQKVIDKIQEHFRQRPFDKIRWGLLKIETKEGDVVDFILNEEQEVLQDILEKHYYANQPVDIIMLKARQIGGSTWASMVNYCLLSTNNHRKHCCMSYLEESNDAFMNKIEFAHENEPTWIKPNIVGRRPLTFNGLLKKTRLGSTLRTQSAERRERVGRSFTYQFLHSSELAFYPPKDQDAIMSAADKVMPEAWPRIRIDESTGRVKNDGFHTRFMAAYEGRLGDVIGIFFPVHEHSAYVLPLEDGVTEKQFLDSLAERDKQRMDQYKLSIEQINWYVTKRAKELTREDMTEDLFMREYPMCIDEAFTGLASNYFDGARNGKDQKRLENQKVTPFMDLPKCISENFDKGPALSYARCVLFTDHQKKCKTPVLTDASDGLWRLWEKPSTHHSYIITADIARGVAVSKMSPTNTDFSVIDVWRYTYGARQQMALTQVAQYRNRVIGPRELAHEAVAISEIYKGRERRALLIGENNAHGLSFVEEAKELGAFQYMRKQFGKAGELIGESLGFTTTTGEVAQGSKNALISSFRKQWNLDKVIICSPSTVMEMGTFANIDGKLGGIGSSHDDTVIAASLMVEGVRFMTGHADPVFVNVSDGGESLINSMISRPIWMVQRAMEKAFGGVLVGSGAGAGDSDEERDYW